MLFLIQKEGMYMKKIWTKYSGVIFLYSVILVGVFSLNARFKYLEELEIIEERNTIAVIGD